MGAEAIFETGNPLPEETLTVCKNADAVLFGAIGDPYFDNNPDARLYQDVGLDGRTDADESSFFSGFLSDVTASGNSTALAKFILLVFPAELERTESRDRVVPE